MNILKQTIDVLKQANGELKGRVADLTQVTAGLKQENDELRNVHCAGRGETVAEACDEKLDRISERGEQASSRDDDSSEDDGEQAVLCFLGPRDMCNAAAVSRTYCDIVYGCFGDRTDEEAVA